VERRNSSNLNKARRPEESTKVISWMQFFFVLVGHVTRAMVYELEWRHLHGITMWRPVLHSYLFRNFSHTRLQRFPSASC
jgi:sarcosine oxidase delta subunit